MDGDEIKIDELLKSNNIPLDIKWLGVSAMTITNDIVYYIYLPNIKMGWHFYKNNDLLDSTIVKYIGDDPYSELAQFLAVHISDNENEFSYKEKILNDIVICLEKNNLRGALANLIALVRQVKELEKCEKLYILYQSYLMLNQLEDSRKIEPNYFKGNLVEECGFTEKYREMIENSRQKFSIKEYLFDIIQLIKSDEKVSLDFWLRNVEVYVLDQSYVYNERTLEEELKQTIPHIVGDVIN